MTDAACVLCSDDNWRVRKPSGQPRFEWADARDARPGAWGSLSGAWGSLSGAWGSLSGACELPLSPAAAGWHGMCNGASFPAARSFVPPLPPLCLPSLPLPFHLTPPFPLSHPLNYMCPCNRRSRRSRRTRAAPWVC
jgi:hypothetical protein